MKPLEEVLWMREFVYDYGCRTVGESITKYAIGDDWCAEFDVWEGVFPSICIQVDQILKAPAMMDLKIRVAAKENDEYPGCIVCPDNKTIAFKVDSFSDLTKAMEGK